MSCYVITCHQLLGLFVRDLFQKDRDRLRFLLEAVCYMIIGLYC